MTDHQHRKVFLDACAAGKDIYCEKPMSHTVEDGFAMIECGAKRKAHHPDWKPRVSSILYAKAKEIYDSGKLGEVFSIEAYWDRNTASGAWVYPIPPDANERTIDWSILGVRPNGPLTRPLFPLAMLHGLRRGPGRRPVRSPHFRNSLHHRHQHRGATCSIHRRPVPLEGRT